MKKTWFLLKVASVLAFAFSLMILAVLYGSHLIETQRSNAPTQKECTSLGFRDMSW